MIKIINLADDKLAQGVLDIQGLAYRIEADLIGFDGIPALHESINKLKSSSEIFIGYFIDDTLLAVLSYSIDDKTLDIGRLVVHPDYFRRGIGKALVQYVEAIEGISRIIVSTGTGNTPAQTLYERMGFQTTGQVKLTDDVSLSQYEKHIA